MAMERCLHCGKPHTHATNGEHAPRPYTPTLEGFERFLREAVGLHTGTPDNTREAFGVSHEGRKGK